MIIDCKTLKRYSLTTPEMSVTSVQHHGGVTGTDHQQHDNMLAVQGQGGVIIISVFSSCAEDDTAPFFRDDFSNRVDGVNKYVAYLIA